MSMARDILVGDYDGWKFCPREKDCVMPDWVEYSYSYLGWGSIPFWVLVVGAVIGAVMLISGFLSMISEISDVVAPVGAVLGLFLTLTSAYSISIGDTSASLQEHLKSEYQVEMVSSDTDRVDKSDLRTGVRIDAPGDEVIRFTVGKDGHESFQDEDRQVVDIDAYRALDAESIADEIEEVAVMTSPRVSFAKAEMNGVMASEDSDAVLVSGEVDGESVRANVLVDDHGQVRDVRVQGGESLMK